MTRSKQDLAGHVAVVGVKDPITVVATAMGLDPADSARSLGARPVALTDSGTAVKVLLN